MRTSSPAWAAKTNIVRARMRERLVIPVNLSGGLLVVALLQLVSVQRRVRAPDASGARTFQGWYETESWVRGAAGSQRV